MYFLSNRENQMRVIGNTNKKKLKENIVITKLEKKTSGNIIA